MDKAVSTIQQIISRPQGLPVGAVMTEAKRLARNREGTVPSPGTEVLHDAVQRDRRGRQDISDTHRVELVGTKLVQICASEVFA